MSLSHRSEDPADRAEARAQDRVDRAEDHADERAEERTELAHDRSDTDTGTGTGTGTGTEATPVHDGATSYQGRAAELGLDRNAVRQREKERYGGVRLGAAFCGWLAATGAGILLTALLAGAGTAVSVATNPQTGQTVQTATVGVAGGIALLCILFLAYLCGGYVAGRMARFNGIQQGVAVWIIAVVVAVGVAILGAIAGRQYDVLGTLN